MPYNIRIHIRYRRGAAEGTQQAATTTTPALLDRRSVMLAFLPHPRHFFDADADDRDALFGALPARGCRARAIGARAALAPSGSMQLAREGDCYIISAALPGVRPEEISCIEVVGNRAVRLEVKKTRPRAAPAAPAPAAHVEAPAAHSAHEAPASGGDAEEPVVEPEAEAGRGRARKGLLRGRWRARLWRSARCGADF